MNELHRMQYLDALGIEMYMPRKVLPVGRMSPVCKVSPVPAMAEAPVPGPGLSPAVEGRAVEDRAAGDNAEQTAELKSSGMGVSIDAILGGAAAPVAANAVAGEPMVPGHDAEETAVGEEADPVSFSLCIWVSGQCLIVDSHRTASALPTDALMDNMIRAMGWGRSAAELFSWPMAEMPSLVDESSARDVLQSLVDVKIETASVSKCLLMGEVAAFYCADREQVRGRTPESWYEHSLGQCIPTLYQGLSAQVVPALETLLLNPSQKKLAWQGLQRLSV